MSKPVFCNSVQGNKHRAHQWINTTTLEAMFGVQCNVRWGCWAHVVEGKTVLLFDTEDAAKAKAKELSKPAREA
ncbi:hypothetical protein [Pararhizobium mangrovi]|uniref:Uncharacterized protein n=1 Tax=Pararhizobium mangrovi TaxID=2590452 RepID=A0A506U0W5_9HYPH|nr:hypothetical protein [Pararhizobium mangrovi]TPW26851.1 hypothetical protein FJU11_13680 [Pararhizobium mangrovi]